MNQEKCKLNFSNDSLNHLKNFLKLKNEKKEFPQQELEFFKLIKAEKIEEIKNKLSQNSDLVNIRDKVKFIKINFIILILNEEW